MILLLLLLLVLKNKIIDMMTSDPGKNDEQVYEDRFYLLPDREISQLNHQSSQYNWPGFTKPMNANFSLAKSYSFPIDWWFELKAIKIKKQHLSKKIK